MDDRLSGIFGALSDPTRRAVLLRLRQGPARIGDLAGPFQMSLAGVGKHIRVLEKAGLIERRISGREHICTLNAKTLVEPARWLEGYRDFWEGSLASLADFVEAETHNG